MAEDDHGRPGPGDLQTPFLFVPHGDPLPLDWMARHPGWVKFPATMVPRRPAARAGMGAQAQARPAAPLATPVMDAAILGMTAGRAAAISGVLDAYGTAAVVAAPLAVPLAPELVLVLVVVGGILVWQYMTREQARSLEAPLATPLPPPLPANPGFVPPPIVPDRPADAGLPSARPVPDLPGLPQTDPLPHVLSTPIPEQAAPTVFHHDRNEGLQGGARTHSSRARKAARVADPDVTQALHDAEWEAHHLVSVAAARANRKILAAAVRAGWRMDDAANTVALPASRTAQKKLHDAGTNRPIHDNAHPKWNARIRGEIEDIPQRLKKDGFVEGTSSYDQAARKAFEAIQDEVRREMLKLDRITINEEASGISNV